MKNLSLCSLSSVGGGGGCLSKEPRKCFISFESLSIQFFLCENFSIDFKKYSEHPEFYPDTCSLVCFLSLTELFQMKLL